MPFKDETYRGYEIHRESWGWDIITPAGIAIDETFLSKARAKDFIDGEIRKQQIEDALVQPIKYDDDGSVVQGHHRAAAIAKLIHIAESQNNTNPKP